MNIEEYFGSIIKEVEKAYEIANIARKKGFDPEDQVAIPLTQNMAERVEGLISVIVPEIKNSGISERINELEEQYGKLSWKVAFTVALETAKERFCSFPDKIKAMETGIRVGLAYLTLGVVASPLEGFVELKLKRRQDNNNEYFCLMFSGPIRSAGGTAAAVSVIVADYIRKQMGYDEYDPTKLEVKRAATELYDYHDRVTNLQYLPSEAEIEFMASNLPVQIAGDPSEKFEVSNYKDLPRIDTNIIRNGFCLVMGECLCQKAPKIWNQISKMKEFDLGSWGFLKDFVKLQKSKKAKKKEDTDEKLSPDFTFIKDLVAGRPILGFPMRNGSFRLRYGRSRNSGYSSAAIHPATTYILDKFTAVGTQLKMERPGKAASLSTCDSIEGPLVRLTNGTVLRINDMKQAKKVSFEVAQIIYLGDILVNYGDFFNRAHKLVPAGYCEEWWIKEYEQNKEEVSIPEKRLKEILSERYDSSITAEEALEISEKCSIPLHPKYTYYWNSLKREEMKALIKWLDTARLISEDNKIRKIITEYKEEKALLERLGVPHSTVAKEFVVIEGDDARILSQFITLLKEDLPEAESNVEAINKISSIKQRDRGGVFIGARMGRPEKAKVRKMDGQPHCLFPIGQEGGRLRSFQAALEKGRVVSDFPVFECGCGNQTVLKVCEKCGARTERRFFNKAKGTLEEKQDPERNATFRNQAIDINSIFNHTIKNLGLSIYPDLIKGVRGTSNRDHMPEHLAKGILRAKHKIPVNKDGTTRYDMTQLAITHFTPQEVSTPIEKLNQLGYEKDIYGNGLTEDTQVIELFPQDMILPAATESQEEGADEVLFRSALFIDDLLKRLYKQQPFYKLKSKADLVGQLVIALAPHTSAAIVGRIIGFSQTQGFYAHPMLHAATRRDCDGDEACVTLLVDALLNFSRQYLPNTRGATQDAPLVLTAKLTVSEVDDMVFDVDIAEEYPLEFYEAAMEYKSPWEVKVRQVKHLLQTKNPYQGLLFTHHTSNINDGVKCSAYKTLPSMQEKLHGQMDLALKIRAVDEAEVAKIVIEKHFIKDIRGNLRKFSQQQFRCVSCNQKYRRPPLAGKCIKCDGKIIFTISEGSIVKYLEPALSLAEHYNLPNYLKQSLELTKVSVESIFGKDKEKQAGLGKWF
ncbi:DNA polymerase II large subunit [Candidatus Woesearchaeota archaeon]|nr:DNA polymerase II large subunit [Candidatus Woesearchaeota archaeon]